LPAPPAGDSVALVPDLSGFPALDVAVGLTLLYFLLSTFCSMVNEGIANVLGWRAKTLEDALRNMLGDPQVKRGWREWLGRIGTQAPAEPGEAVPTDLTSELFAHWRITGLVRNPGSTRRRRSRPSYLPPRAFSLAVAETLAQQAPDAAAGPSPWEQADHQILEGVERSLASLPKGQVRQVLHKAAVNAEGSLEQFRAQVERAFDDAMERASGWYKRKVQVVILVLAVLVAIGLNVDSARVATRLWNDEAIRTAVAAKAGGGELPQDAANAVDQVDQLQLPIGWGAGNAPDGVGEVLGAVPGWLVTIAAVGLGAQFWFDLLSRLARLRGSGVPEKPRSLSDTAGTVPR
jgi:hypothetical protein